MNRLAFAALLISAFALAQDRTVTVREAGVKPHLVEIPLLADGGCALTVYATNDAGIEVQRGAYPFNGARCATVRTAATKAANRDISVGDGAAP